MPVDIPVAMPKVVLDIAVTAPSSYGADEIRKEKAFIKWRNLNTSHRNNKIPIVS